MRRFFHASFAAIFLIWTMPLGAFIGVSQQKTACDGRRAFHMCSMMGAGKKTSPEKISFVNASSAEKMPKSQGSGANDFIHRVPGLDIMNAQTAFVEFSQIPSHSDFVFPIDPVPKP